MTAKKPTVTTKRALTPKCSHAGHRQRMKNKYIEFGPRVFEDHELLEILLYYSTPQKNTNDIAHELIDKFGSPRNAIEADRQRLMQVKGVKHNTAILFSLISEAFRRGKAIFSSVGVKYDKLSAVGELFTEHLSKLSEERFCILMLDGAMRMIKLATLSGGSANSMPVDPRAIARMALSENATNVIIAHNHPSGNAIPSSNDRDLTARIEAALSAIGITLIEHIVVGEVGYSPTMQMRISSLHSPLSSSSLDDGFLRKFYNS